jgi:hypothetical protein
MTVRQLLSQSQDMATPAYNPKSKDRSSQVPAFLQFTAASESGASSSPKID